MPELTLYHLTARSAFHLGQRGVGQEETGVHLPSDSLFAALVAAYVEAGGPATDLTQGFEPGQPDTDPVKTPFLLTSAFPRAGEVRFYPALPLSLLKLTPGKINHRLKELKAIQFVSEGIFKKAIAGEALDEWLPVKDESQITTSSQGFYLQGGSLWLTAGEVEALPSSMRPGREQVQRYRALRHQPVWQTSKVPRVTVDRHHNASNIFHTGRLTFSPECGWWFGLAWLQPAQPAGNSGQTQAQVIQQALNLLADTGLGGERAAGYGHFDCRQAGTGQWTQPAPGELFVTPSRYHPRPTELPAALQDASAAYKLVSVAGWLNSPEAHSHGQAKAQRRRRLWLVAEGSVVRAVGSGPWGDVTDVRPVYSATGMEFPHPIWRYGLAYPVVLKGDNP